MRFAVFINSKKMEIKNIIFDFGGVICDLLIDECIANFRKLGINGNMFPAEYCQFEGIFKKIDRGLISPAEFYDELRKINNVPDVTDSQIRDAWNSLIAPVQAERFEAFKSLKEDHDLYILSNTNEIHWDYIVNHIMVYEGESVMPWFRHAFASHELHLEKPEAAIYRAVLDTAGIEAAETLFIDDNRLNLDGAAKLGINTMLSKGGDWIGRLLG